jgi:hypothetical protein
MTTATLSITLGLVNGFAAGAAVAAIGIKVVGVANPTPITKAVAADATTATFDLAPDTWTFTAVPLDAAGNPLTAEGYSAPSTTLKIAAPATVTLTVPTGVSAA